ncbi:MAG TPA: Crp/Fnr family transcriptional regulator [Burkholderiales bacterium]|nr:Crp/Fnr family transcriptional regulator [Burkholderiales bacterium]
MSAKLIDKPAIDKPVVDKLNGAPNGRVLIEDLLSQLPMFSAASRQDVRSVAAQSSVLAGERNSVLARRGDIVRGIFAVARGSVKLSLGRGAHDERILRIVGAGQAFAQASALLGQPLPYDAVAVEQSRVLMIPAAALLAVIEHDAAFARSLVLRIAESELALYAEMEATTLQSSAERLAAYLDQLAGRAAAGACTVHLPYSKTLIAARLGMKKETLSRLLRRFVAEGLIEVGKRDIGIRDRGRLAAAAGVDPGRASPI